MWKYVIQDLKGAAQYIPYGILIGGLLYFVLYIIQRRRKTKEKVSAVKLVFWIYVAIIMMITFLSREDGSSGGIEWGIGASLGINNRNDAYAIENVLLFLPYGFLLQILWERKRSFVKCIGVGFWTSLCIECLQYLSGRGVFQMDDLIANTVGAAVGYLFYYFLVGVGNVFKKKKPSEIQ